MERWVAAADSVETRLEQRMTNIGGSELLIVLVLALILLGPRRLPEVGEALGRTLRRFRSASNELRDEIDVLGESDAERKKRK
jgi:Tat protein translocase TatB subunit